VQRARHARGDRSAPRDPDESLSIDAGAIKPWGPNVSEKTGWAHGFRGQILAQLGIDFDRRSRSCRSASASCCCTARATARSR
jgi:hypothetical protein